MPRPYVLRRHQSWTRELHLCLLGVPPPVPLSVPSSAPVPATLRLREDASSAVRLGMAITPEMTRAPAAWMLAVLADWRPAFLHLTLWPETPTDAVDWSGVRALLQAADATLRLDLCGREGLGYAGAHDAACRSLALQMAQAGVIPAAVAALSCGAQAASFCVKFSRLCDRWWHPAFLCTAESAGGQWRRRFHGLHGLPYRAWCRRRGCDERSAKLAVDARHARRRHPNRQWHIGPSTLSARASPLGRQPQTDGQRRMPLASRDPRTRGLFGAAWLLGHLAAASRADVQALTLPPLVGEDGLWALTGNTHQMTPSAAMLQICMRWNSLEEVLPQAANDGVSALPALAAIGGRTAQGRQILLANLSADAQRVPWPHGGQWACLDAHSWIQHQDSLASSPWRASGDCPVDLVIAPYGLARIDLPFLTGD